MPEYISIDSELSLVHTHVRDPFQCRLPGVESIGRAAVVSDGDWYGFVSLHDPLADHGFEKAGAEL